MTCTEERENDNVIVHCMYACTCIETDENNATHTVQIWAMPVALNSAKTVTHDGATVVFTLRNFDRYCTCTMGIK